MKTIARREDYYQYFKVFLASLMVLVFLFFRQMITYAAEYTVTNTNAVLYTAMQTGVYAEPDAQTVAITVLDINLPIAVTGITSNGWFQIDLGGVYYVPGAALTAPTAEQTQASSVPAYITPNYAESVSYTVNSIEEVEAAALDANARHATTVTVYANNLDSSTVRDAFDPHKSVASYGMGTSNGLGTSIMWSGGKTTYTFTYKRMSTIEEELYTDAMVAQLVPQFNTGSSYDKIKAVHDYICNTVSYSAHTRDNYVGYDYRSAYDALFSQQTVCTGYALLFQKFMDQMGIPCYMAHGTLNGAGHAWNIVQLDGQWYHMDCTNSDPRGRVPNKYFLRGADFAGPTWGDLVISPTDYKIPY